MESNFLKRLRCGLMKGGIKEGIKGLMKGGIKEGIKGLMKGGIIKSRGFLNRFW
ncbi:hypothetical protein FE356_06850 [Helicobacter pylori]|nr:hypothetical protein FE356_04980 [Helicobacter pylori]WQW99252.1 hypothetical protein FE356_06850 [Helicobacter pylori]